MAALDVTRKPQIYHTLYLINSALSGVVGHLQTLDDFGMLRREYTRLYQSFTQELQAQINDETFEILAAIELDDLHRFGTARDQWEKSLHDPNDYLLLAEERKREIAEERKRELSKRKKSSKKTQKTRK